MVYDFAAQPWTQTGVAALPFWACKCGKCGCLWIIPAVFGVKFSLVHGSVTAVVEPRNPRASLKLLGYWGLDCLKESFRGSVRDVGAIFSASTCATVLRMPCRGNNPPYLAYSKGLRSGSVICPTIKGASAGREPSRTLHHRRISPAD